MSSKIKDSGPAGGSISVSPPAASIPPVSPNIGIAAAACIPPGGPDPSGSYPILPGEPNPLHGRITAAAAVDPRIGAAAAPPAVARGWDGRISASVLNDTHAAMMKDYAEFAARERAAAAQAAALPARTPDRSAYEQMRAARDAAIAQAAAPAGGVASPAAASVDPTYEQLRVARQAAIARAAAPAGTVAPRAAAPRISAPATAERTYAQMKAAREAAIAKAAVRR